jgi:histidyl-tRNA synthetase
MGITYQIDPRLVRGLDYYCHTAFEFVTETLGALGTVRGGGRSDGLGEPRGGPPTPGVGWAAGIERLAMMLAASDANPRVIAVVPVGDGAAPPALKLTEDLRRAGFAVDLGFGGNLKKRMARADKIKAAAAVIIGNDELAKGVVTLRDLQSGMQEQVSLVQLPHRLAAYRR